MITGATKTKYADWSTYDPAQDAAKPQPLQTIALKVVTLAQRACQLDETGQPRDEDDPFEFISLGQMMMARGDDEQLGRRQLAAFLGHLPGERKRQLHALMAFGRSSSTDFVEFATHLADEAMARIVAVATGELARNLYLGLKRADDLGLGLE